MGISQSIKTVEVPSGTLGDIMLRMNKDAQASGLDKVRGILTLKLNQFMDIKFTEDEIRKLAEQFQYIELGSCTALVMTCDKKKCLYKNRCVLYANNKCPEGKDCIHETMILKDAMNNYVESFNIERDNYAEMVMVNQLVEFELIEHRCNAKLSHDHNDLQMTSVIGIDDSGNIITKEEISYAIMIKDNNFKKKMALLQEFTATRKEIYKKQAALKQAQEGPAKLLSGLKKKVLAAKEQSVIPEEVAAKLNPLNDDNY